MPSYSPNYNLTLYSSADTDVPFLTYRLAQNGPNSSNMLIIDSAMHGLDSRVQALETVKSNIPVSAVLSGGNTYAATVSAITGYVDGMGIALSLNTTNSGSVILNINNLGNVNLEKIDNTASLVSMNAGDLRSGRVYLFRYNAAYGVWQWEQGTSGDQINVGGTTNNVTYIDSNNALADSGIAISNLVTKNSAARPNLLINGSFAINQRQFSGAVGASWVFAVDRWRAFRETLASGMSVATFGGIYNKYGLANYITIQRLSGDTSLQPMVFIQEFTTVDSIQFQGEYATLTFAIATPGSGYNGTLNIQILGGTGTDQSYVGGITGTTVLAQGNFTPTASLQNCSVTTSAPIPGTISQIFAKLSYTPNAASAPANESFAIYGAKMELGSSFSGWTWPTYQQTLADCQRFCFVKNFVNGYGYRWGSGQTISTSQAEVVVQFPVAMRLNQPGMRVVGTVSNLSISAYGNLYPLNQAPVYTAYTLDNYGASLTLTTATSLPQSLIPATLRGGGGTLLIFEAEL